MYQGWWEMHPGVVFHILLCSIGWGITSGTAGLRSIHTDLLISVTQVSEFIGFLSLRERVGVRGGEKLTL
jgi:hypothetical protein